DAPRATMRTDRGLAGASALSSRTSAGAADASTRYGFMSISRICETSTSRARTAALLPESHSPQWQVAIELGSRTAITPGTSYACPHFGQRIRGIAWMIAAPRSLGGRCGTPSFDERDIETPGLCDYTSPGPYVSRKSEPVRRARRPPSQVHHRVRRPHPRDRDPPAGHPAGARPSRHDPPNGGTGGGDRAGH